MNSWMTWKPLRGSSITFNVNEVRPRENGYKAIWKKIWEITPIHFLQIDTGTTRVRQVYTVYIYTYSGRIKNIVSIFGSGFFGGIQILSDFLMYKTLFSFCTWSATIVITFNEKAS